MIYTVPSGFDDEKTLYVLYCISYTVVYQRLTHFQYLRKFVNFCEEKIFGPKNLSGTPLGFRIQLARMEYNYLGLNG